MPSKEPSRTKVRNAKIAAESAALPKIPKEVLDQIVVDGRRIVRPSATPQARRG